MKDEAVILALAEQSYMFHLLTMEMKKRGELGMEWNPEKAWNNSEFALFLSEFRQRYFPESRRPSSPNTSEP